MFRTLLSIAIASALLAPPALARPSHPKWPPKDYALCYGHWDEDRVARAHQFDLVVVHPGHDFSTFTPELVDRLKRGRDGLAGTADDVVVLAYVSIGEDDQPPAGPPTARPLSGPSFFANGKWSQAKAGYPTRFLDQVAYLFESNGERRYGPNGKPVSQPGQDGIPDENGVWGSYYVNAGDVEWQDMVLQRTRRLQEEFRVDGFFLDTLDTASPWGSYRYSQPQMVSMLGRIRKAHPDHFVLANRGMFLLDTHPKEFISSIDGLLYESLYAIWDWGAQQGVQSPWVVGDYAAYKSPLLGASRRPPGFHLFFVNYLNPQQPDFFPIMHAVEDLVGRAGVSNYVSDPLLHGVSQPYSQIFPEQSSAGLPELGQLSVLEQSQGRFAVDLELSRLGDQRLGQDVFLDVRWGTVRPPEAEIALLPALRVDPSKFFAEGDRLRGRVEGVGFEKGTKYFIFARLVGKQRAQRTPYLEVSLTTAQGPQPSQVSELQASSLESSVQLAWKGKASRYRIYRGSSPAQLQAVAEAKGSPFQVMGLTNGVPQYFSVAALDDQDREGALCPPILARAEDCTPPNSPTELEIQTQGKQVSLTWSPVQDAKTYKVYCTLASEKYRIPVVVEAPQTQLSLGRLARGKYRVWVTAVDSAGNESRRNQRLEVEMK